MKDNKLSSSIKIPLTEKQKESIENAAKKYGFNTMSEYIRFLLTKQLREDGYLKDDDDDE